MYDQTKHSFQHEKIFTDKVSSFLGTFQIVANKARQSCLSQLVLGVIKSRQVQLPAIAEAIRLDKEGAQLSSIIHRLEDFFRESTLDFDAIALLLVLILGDKGKLRLCIDRTNWEFGNCSINILMVIVCNGSNHVPIYFELLDNKNGNSNSQQRIELLEKIVALIGVKRIGIVIGDREFIGHTWLKYLKEQGINFCVRVPKHHQIERMDGTKYLAEDLATENPLYLKDCLVDGVWVQVYLKKLPCGELLFLIGTVALAQYLGQIYKKRWTIETCFQSFKGRGFDIESTHIKDLGKLKKLIAVVSIAFAICINMGIHQDKKIRKIKTKNHKYKVNSFCRTGIDLIKDLLKGSPAEFENMMDKFIRYLYLKLYRYNKEKNINSTLSST
ncbi:MAG: IS4 family transposase [Flectobacillus sp.]|jgi:hypothetical protein|uniref:IS4 family transposase n=1 Tax=Flectobacillus sp. TaxID=50419 RepID=UPI003B9D388B